MYAVENDVVPIFDCIYAQLKNNTCFDFIHYSNNGSSNTVQILCIETDRSQQKVQTKIRLLLKKQSDQGLHCLPFHQHLLEALMQCYIKLFYF